MNSDAFIVNCSRGAVVNEDDLVLALQEKQIRGAALDVFFSEPLPGTSTLRKNPAVLLTPHLGGFTEEARLRASQEAVEKVIDFLNEKPVSSTLPVEAAWFKDL